MEFRLAAPRAFYGNPHIEKGLAAGKISVKLMQSDWTFDGAVGCADYHWQLEACHPPKNAMLLRVRIGAGENTKVRRCGGNRTQRTDGLKWEEYG
jgi:hypothetical protein